MVRSLLNEEVWIIFDNDNICQRSVNPMPFGCISVTLTKFDTNIVDLFLPGSTHGLQDKSECTSDALGCTHSSARVLAHRDRIHHMRTK